MEQDLSRCPKCNHFWTSHDVDAVRGLMPRAFCWVVGCDCTQERPEAQKVVA